MMHVGAPWIGPDKFTTSYPGTPIPNAQDVISESWAPLPEQTRRLLTEEGRKLVSTGLHGMSKQRNALVAVQERNANLQASLSHARSNACIKKLLKLTRPPVVGVNVLTSAVAHENASLLVGVLRAWSVVHAKLLRREGVVAMKTRKVIDSATGATLFRFWHQVTQLCQVECITSEREQDARNILDAEEAKLMRIANAPARTCWYLYSNEPGCSGATSFLCMQTAFQEWKEEVQACAAAETFASTVAQQAVVTAEKDAHAKNGLVNFAESLQKRHEAGNAMQSRYRALLEECKSELDCRQKEMALMKDARCGKLWNLMQSQRDVKHRFLLVLILRTWGDMVTEAHKESHGDAIAESARRTAILAGGMMKHLTLSQIWAKWHTSFHSDLLRKSYEQSGNARRVQWTGVIDRFMRRCESQRTKDGKSIAFKGWSMWLATRRVPVERYIRTRDELCKRQYFCGWMRLWAKMSARTRDSLQSEVGLDEFVNHPRDNACVLVALHSWRLALLEERYFDSILKQDEQNGQDKHAKFAFSADQLLNISIGATTETTWMATYTLMVWERFVIDNIIEREEEEEQERLQEEAARAEQRKTTMVNVNNEAAKQLRQFSALTKTNATVKVAMVEKMISVKESTADSPFLSLVWWSWVHFISESKTWQLQDKGSIGGPAAKPKQLQFEPMSPRDLLKGLGSPRENLRIMSAPTAGNDPPALTRGEKLGTQRRLSLDNKPSAKALPDPDGVKSEPTSVGVRRPYQTVSDNQYAELLRTPEAAAAWADLFPDGGAPINALPPSFGNAASGGQPAIQGPDVEVNPSSSSFSGTSTGYLEEKVKKGTDSERRKSWLEGLRAESVVESAKVGAVALPEPEAPEKSLAGIAAAMRRSQEDLDGPPPLSTAVRRNSFNVG
eukprot:gnl/MRDRNA2_/MRDRNA2_27614_c0_seq1.p1 gnl/MRDRNA2_/MRDRNA2_27614_c0~~gnl/MRDRNA2_/MRDRNA2_27614_c0_seq1.p1  ORF type:complete len:901 (-),score=181.85 gnl/MRDRNA2_/MRDRNA2_27614_c0_seq1:27-2729(-)